MMMATPTLRAQTLFRLIPVTSNSNNNNQSAAPAPTNPPGRHTRSNSALGSGREVSDDASNPKAAREINKLGGWLGVAGNDLDALSETENSETNFVIEKFKLGDQLCEKFNFGDQLCE